MKLTSVTAAALFAAAGALLAQSSVEETIQSIRIKSPQMKSNLLRDIPAVKNASSGGYAIAGQDFLFAVNAPGASAPALVLDEGTPRPLTRIDGSDLWYRLEKMRTGVTYAYQFVVDGKPLAPRTDIAAYNPDSYAKPGVPQGKLSDKFVITSKLYNGMTADYWIYASPGIDPAKPAPLMVWQDGQGLLNRNSGMRLFTVTENLIAQKLIPPMVYLLIAPGFTPDNKPMRAIEYDTVTNKYTQFLMREVLPEVEKLYKLRPDGYSRAIGGSSSGAICSFTAGWFHPELFSRIHSTVGSYTSIQWRPEEKLDGGNLYPFKVRKEPKRNIRVWMSDGADDLENNHGSWPLQNIQLANSLKMREYDFHFRFGTAAHNGAQAALDLPESLTWLWRGYDPEKTEEIYRMESAEKDRPYYRVKIANREAW
jgi:enterochelin esterase-like enzyme